MNREAILHEVFSIVGKYWLQLFLTTITGAFAFIWKKIDKMRKDQKKEEDALKNAVKALLRDRIYEVSETAINKGSITDISLGNLKFIYKEYMDLGDGDAIVSDIVEDVCKLPIVVHKFNG